ncbi:MULTISPECIES: hypothetical protein [Cyanophyceae]|uniref:hypothetical protein n=1 Tax=Cyanophyceae TaxID=3028117 RepID=UPI0016887CE2|nr:MULTISPECIES: hypothetical protein [Cyanophyceae]MBD1916013.1 hypothetical protein [Phormidium sp. FACHB-77]MBD2031718.1 hypothetical protein [Phormidium sp. FACHB-322]MBD2052655.1 hypothetical protein [Leptolyngbya sp. FACHB-60]
MIISILLVALWAAYNVSPRINFWVTSSARQSVVNRVLSNNTILDQQEREVVLQDNIIETALLGKATAYISQNYQSVYFNYYKRGSNILHQAAFFVYTSDPASIDPRYIQLKRLKNNWFFLLRGYAD